MCDCGECVPRPRRPPRAKGLKRAGTAASVVTLSPSIRTWGCRVGARRAVCGTHLERLVACEGGVLLLQRQQRRNQRLGDVFAAVHSEAARLVRALHVPDRLLRGILDRGADSCVGGAAGRGDLCGGTRGGAGSPEGRAGCQGGRLGRGSSSRSHFPFWRFQGFAELSFGGCACGGERAGGLEEGDRGCVG